MEGDEDKAFILNLYKDYYGLVRKNIYNITRDSNQIEDLINDTFIKLIEKVSLIRNLDSSKAAVYVVYTSRSVAINHIKHRDIEKKHVYPGGEFDLEEIPSLDDDIEYRIIHQEEIKEMGKAVLKLPAKHKYLLYLKYMLGMNDKDIAEILNIAPNSVRQYLT
ncbi:RNA polymerase sigma factor, partial [Syntrophomonas zehnderi]